MSNELLLLLKNIRTTRRTVPAGGVVFRAGDPAQALFHVEQGAIRLERDGHNLMEFGPAETFAEASLFAANYEYDAVALQYSSLKVFPKTAILLLLRAHPDINLAFSSYLVRQMDSLRGQRRILQSKHAEDRICLWLAQAGGRIGPVSLNLPLNAWAHKLGLTREALYRALARLERDGRLERVETRTFRLL